MILIYFGNTTYLFTQYVGGTPGLNLNNFGEEYQRFYIHDSEIRSAQWIQKNYDFKSAIYADDYAWLRFQSWTLLDKGIVSDLTPRVIDKYGYVFASYTNVVNNIARRTYKNTFLAYFFPKHFLEQNKNIIYSNGSSVIYK